ncbi:MAG: Holliday junction resolvase RuvX [Mariprofundaceae bacterium]
MVQIPDAASHFSKILELPLLALDIGSKRIGVAVCDRLGISCRGIACLHRNDKQWPQQLLKHIREYGCKGIVVGLAKNMDGSEGPQAEDCRAAAKEVQKASGLAVALWDERLSTWSAKERLRGQGLNEKKVAEKVDQTAAAIILEDYLTAHPELKSA